VAGFPRWLLVLLVVSQLLAATAVALGVRRAVRERRVPVGTPIGAVSAGMAARPGVEPPTAVSVESVSSPPSNVTGIIEPRVVAPTCDTLLPDLPPPSGTANPAALAEELQGARRALLKGDLDDAERCYCRAARWDPNSPAVLGGMARLLLMRGDGPAAGDWATRAVRASATDPDLRALLGDALARSDHHDDARIAWLAAAGIAAGDAPAVLGLVRHAISTGEDALEHRDPSRAELHFRRAAVLEPDNVDAALGLVRALLATRRSDAAVQWGRRAVTLAPANAAAHILLGDALAQGGDGMSAAQEWREAERLEPQSQEIRRRLSRLPELSATW
jgi:Flp pilus assembly protein TadD